jgi:hypothetical protein
VCTILEFQTEELRISREPTETTNHHTLVIYKVQGNFVGLVRLLFCASSDSRDTSTKTATRKYHLRGGSFARLTRSGGAPRCGEYLQRNSLRDIPGGCHAPRVTAGTGARADALFLHFAPPEPPPEVSIKKPTKQPLRARRGAPSPAWRIISTSDAHRWCPKVWRMSPAFSVSRPFRRMPRPAGDCIAGALDVEHFPQNVVHPEPLTLEHAGSERPVTRAGMGSHRSVARLSLHTSLTSPPAERPPHTTSPGRVPNHFFTPSRDALHTLISRHASTSPSLFWATRAHTSGRPVARFTAQSAASSSAMFVLPVCL